MTLLDSLALAVNTVSDEVADATVQANPFLGEMMKRMVYHPGGYQYQFATGLISNVNQGAINGTTDMLGLNLQQHFVQALLDWKYYYFGVSLSMQDQTTAMQGEEVLLDIVAGKAAMAKNTFIQLLSQDMFGSAASNTKKINGLSDVFAASGTAYAGINNSTYANWFYEYDSTSTRATYAAIAGLISQIQANIGQAPVDPVLRTNYKINLIISNPATRQSWLNQNYPLVRLAPSDNLEAGWNTVQFMGIPWFADYYSPGSADGSSSDNNIYILSMDSFHMFYNSWIDKKPSDFNNDQILPGQSIMASTKLCAFNLACQNRRVNGLMDNIIA